MRSETILLFNDYHLDSVLEGQAKKIRELVSKIPAQHLIEADVEELIPALEKELRVEPIQFLEDDITVDQTETKVDVSRDFMRAISDRSRPFYIDGLRVSYYVPFTGDPELFKCKPNSFTMNPLHARISGHELAFDYDRADRDVVATRPAFDRDFTNVRQWTGWVLEQVEAFNHGLSNKLRQELNSRQQNLKASQQKIGDLGFKVRPKVTESTASNIEQENTPPVSAKRSRKKPTAKAREYDVALSFAGEDRVYVERVATVLRDAGVQVFYDKFEEVDLWGRNLADHLAQIYANSRFVVMFVSKHYAAKVWPNHERKHAQARALKNQEDVILPARFDDTEIPGLPDTVAYVDLRTLTANELAERIIKKLKVAG
jgi:hypothetical protein